MSELPLPFLHLLHLHYGDVDGDGDGGATKLMRINLPLASKSDRASL